jgi:hypothetical protein
VRTKVFISYSHQDEPWLQRLAVHLGSLERQGLVDGWSNTRISPGADWRAEIERALAEARIAVLLVSGPFLRSNFIRQVELPALLGQAERDGLEIVPLIVSPCLVEDEPWLARLQAVNPPNQPLTGMTLNDQEETLVKAARRVLAAHRGLPAPVEEPAGAARFEQKLSALRRQLLVAAPTDLRRLQYEVEELVTHFPVAEARDLLDQVRHARAPMPSGRSFQADVPAMREMPLAHKRNSWRLFVVVTVLLPALAALLYFFLR